jgi:hypothetical protein
MREERMTPPPPHTQNGEKELQPEGKSGKGADEMKKKRKEK